jgi:hypothetical protein
MKFPIRAKMAKNQFICTHFDKKGNFIGSFSTIINLIQVVHSGKLYLTMRRIWFSSPLCDENEFNLLTARTAENDDNEMQ